MGWGARAGGTVAVVLVATGAYLTADAYDLVPGLLTVEPVPAPAAPFPDAPGAALGDEPVAVAPALADDAPEPSPSDVQGLVDDLAADTRLGKRVGVLVTDRDSGDVLGAHAPTAAFVPASTQKLFTAAAALSTLDPHSTLTTSVVQAKPGDGTIYLHGGGDMLLAAGAGDPEATNGHAGLADLAKQVAGKLLLRGEDSVHLALDDTLFEGPTVSPTWDPRSVAAGYAAPVTPLEVDIARLSDDEYALRSPDPSMAAAQTFAAALEKRGVTVTGDPVRSSVPKDPKQLGAVESAPLWQVVDYFLEHSDNSVTEGVGRLVAIEAGVPATFDGATRAVRTAVQRLDVDTEGMVLADCSGLGDGSKVSPQQLDQVLRAITDPERPRLRTAAVGIPIAGLTGTLAERFVGTDAAGVVRSKTGSLPDVTALSGTVVTADERMLTFVVLADRVPDGGTWGARVIFDRFVGQLADCGCGG
ncbi:D-alanyl-D-alanine carboxypeptidase/D-alanyl-D-alanine-endopeptidase [Cellulomonas sp. PhB143]|uniref:D-alanyl-D-alanine carboxypeptidase/D-alanyl-D-alanine endopeptidase n=1 Tax=Cellulomonas sp. PhB143 TaxID=2485186 RepID=UPI000F479A4F|nr:D-alanyl-D-alanine carboxypeptidase/D-alanyl-D-alanine-endopeptidase [Cellulomonas sp. PhB143]ROS78831.1 D-alanyl-D-alanine carboxypeptidase/D-alanyl-D-alanine-endopeptidase (penicillin-binding protein 4) [Cellulomonas sp. PhB143]